MFFPSVKQALLVLPQLRWLTPPVATFALQLRWQSLPHGSIVLGCGSRLTSVLLLAHKAGSKHALCPILGKQNKSKTALVINQTINLISQQKSLKS